MNESEREQRERRGRSFQAKVKGDSITELENSALLQAQEFFAIDGEGRYFAMIQVWPER